MAGTNYAGLALHIVEGAGGLSGAAAFFTYRLKRREIKTAEKNAEKSAAAEQAKRDLQQAQDFTQTALSLLEPVKHALAEAESRIKALRAQVVNLETAAASLTQAMEALTAASQAERAELEARLAEVTAERDAAQAELAATSAERDALKAELDAYRRQNHGSAVQGS